jgi:hypothetical protein
MPLVAGMDAAKSCTDAGEKPQDTVNNQCLNVFTRGKTQAWLSVSANQAGTG